MPMPWPQAQRGFAAQRARDPDRPVRPLSPYMRFLQKVREESAGTVPAKDVMRRAAQLWKEAEENTRAPFEAEYASERETYQGAMEDYKSSGKLAAWKRDPAKPKRPLTGWLRYLE